MCLRNRFHFCELNISPQKSMINAKNRIQSNAVNIIRNEYRCEKFR